MWQKSIIMKFCGCAEMPWPTNLVSQMQENIITILIFFCENENFDVKLIIHTNCESYLNFSISQYNSNMMFFYIVCSTSLILAVCHCNSNIPSSMNIISAWVMSDLHQQWRLFNSKDNKFHDPTSLHDIIKLCLSLLY